LKATLYMDKVVFDGKDGKDNPVAQYAVRTHEVGAPTVAYIRKAGSRYEPIWQILRVQPDGHLAPAEGAYKTPDEALAVLQEESK
jgi:hypothetical protein